MVWWSFGVGLVIGGIVAGFTIMVLIVGGRWDD